MGIKPLDKSFWKRKYRYFYCMSWEDVPQVIKRNSIFDISRLNPQDLKEEKSIKLCKKVNVHFIGNPHSTYINLIFHLMGQVVLHMNCMNIHEVGCEPLLYVCNEENYVVAEGNNTILGNNEENVLINYGNTGQIIVYADVHKGGVLRCGGF